jgi:hypothetical protein
VKRADLEHIIRAAGSITDTQQLVIVGSQAILGAYPDAPAELTGSAEADTYPLDAPEKADLIDGSIGEKSPFHETFGYYAHGVGPETAVLPVNWRSRLVPVRNENTRGVTGLCLSPVDLAMSKLAAAREKDLRFVTVMLRHGLVSPEEIQRLFGEMEETRLQRIRSGLDQCQAAARL